MVGAVIIHGRSVLWYVDNMLSIPHTVSGDSGANVCHASWLSTSYSIECHMTLMGGKH